jgi:hypothetical protein
MDMDMDYGDGESFKSASVGGRPADHFYAKPHPPPLQGFVIIRWPNTRSIHLQPPRRMLMIILYRRMLREAGIIIIIIITITITIVIIIDQRHQSCVATYYRSF